MSKVCGSCWNPINWCESFNKFGHGDGDDCVHTNQVARALREAGYRVEVFDSPTHNSYIVDIGREVAGGKIELFYSDDTPPSNNVGYSNPRDMLPGDVVALLDTEFGKGEFFN